MHTTTAPDASAAPHTPAEPHPGARLHPTPQMAHLLWAIAAFVGSLAGAAIGGIALGFLLRSGTAIAVGVMVGGALAGFRLLRLGLLGRMGWSVRDLGFHRGRHSLLHLLWFTPVGIIAALIATAIAGSALGASPAQSTTSLQTLEAGPLLGVPMLLLAAVVLPLLEEIVFRRVLLDWMASHMPVGLAAALVVVVFAAAHAVPAVMLYIFFLGIPLVLARLWFGNLWAPLIVHATNNALVSLVALTTLT